MNVLVVGGGGREHAIGWKLRQSPRVDNLFVAPGNAGTASLGTNLQIADTDLDGLIDAARRHDAGLTVVGPETSLAAGIVDRFRAEGLTIAGPSQAAARIESSKAFAKDLMRRWAIPTGAAELFSSHDEARRYVETAPLPLVVKADGLAAGKGVVVCSTRDEALSALRDCMERQVFGPAGETVLIEEFLSGPEVSVFTFTDGTHVSPLVAACDYKRIDDGDQGPNTGGMGSYSPPPFWDASLSNRVMAEIMAPAVRALAAEGCPFTGVLYGGLILTQDGPKVIEFNCRLGDPETQVVMPRLTSDLAEILLATANGTVDLSAVEWSDEACVGVVMASRGYPGTYQRGYPVSGLGSLDPGVVAFHAGTRTDVGPSGEVVTNGGRVVAVAALGESIEAARARAYANVERVGFEGAHYRKDIALLSLPTI